MPPMKPVILNLTPDTINNLLILSPPKQLNKEKVETSKNAVVESGNMLAVNFLKQDFLKNELANQTPYGDNPLEQPLLQQYFLANIFDILAEQLQSDQQQLLANQLAPVVTLLPDYKKETGVIATVGVSTVTLTRNSNSDIESVMVPKDQQTTIIQSQGPIAIKNRVISSGSTSIVLKQN
jgi:hypothetical protein